jgi:hypothetical protein
MIQFQQFEGMLQFSHRLKLMDSKYNLIRNRGEEPRSRHDL